MTHVHDTHGTECSEVRRWIMDETKKTLFVLLGNTVLSLITHDADYIVRCVFLLVLGA